MWYMAGLLVILGLGCIAYVLNLKSSADKLEQTAAVLKEADAKIGALEKTAQDGRQAEHDADFEEAQEVLESGSRDRAIGFLIGAGHGVQRTPKSAS